MLFLNRQGFTSLSPSFAKIYSTASRAGTSFAPAKTRMTSSGDSGHKNMAWAATLLALSANRCCKFASRSWSAVASERVRVMRL